MNRQQEIIETFPKPIVKEDYSDLNMDRKLRLTLIKLTSDLGEKEADRFWVRYGIMLTMNAGLIATISYTLTQSRFLLTSLIGGFGIALSPYFYRIVKLSQFYEGRWRSDMTALIEGDPTLKNALRSRFSSDARMPRPYPRSSTDYAKHLVYWIGAFWGLVVLLSLALSLIKALTSI